MREYYLRQRISEGATNEELQKLIADMDRIDREFETNPSRWASSLRGNYEEADMPHKIKI